MYREEGGPFTGGREAMSVASELHDKSKTEGVHVVHMVLHTRWESYGGCVSNGAPLGVGAQRACDREGTWRSREKGPSFFTMIPLERWNVEREGHFLR
jgi:hypothetical protein